MSLINLTPHNIIINSQNGQSVIQASGIIIRLVIQEKKLEQKSKEYNLSIIKRVINNIEIIRTSDNSKLELSYFKNYLKQNNIKGIIVSAQLVEIMKKEFQGYDILTIGKTIRETLQNGDTVIKGAENLILN